MGLFKEFLNEEPKVSINEIDVEPAVDRGLAAFWREVRMSFPNSKSKDLSPDLQNKFREIAVKVTKSWLDVNNDTPNKDAAVSFSSFNRNQNAVQTSQWNDYHP